jgi:hypothetical protein
MPADIGTVLYVGVTRVPRLADLLLSPICQAVWDKIGKSELDVRRRQVDAELVAEAEKFAMNLGKLDEFKAEMQFKPVCNDVEQEWNDIRSMPKPVARNQPNASPLEQNEALNVMFNVPGEDYVHHMCLLSCLTSCFTFQVRTTCIICA